MWLKNWKGPLASSVLVLGLTVVAGACSGSSSTTTDGTDAAADGSHLPLMHKDAGFEAGGDASSTPAVDSGAGFDGTTGQPCTTDADCTATPGPMHNQCSNDGMYFTGGSPIDPTPICLSPNLCDLGTNPNFIQFCDSADPTDPTSPGLCLPLRAGATGFMGQCYPKCTILPDGSAPIGCPGADTCTLAAIGTDTAGAPIALGVCIGGCAQDSDCPSGSACQKDEGVCKVPSLVQTATKPIGAACGVADGMTATFACVCATNPNTSLGYCSQFCIVGSSTATCPTGYVCDAGLPSTITNQAGATITGFTTQNVGLQGQCMPACSFEAGATDASQGACPGTSRCTGDAAGNVCAP